MSCVVLIAHQTCGTSLSKPSLVGKVLAHCPRRNVSG